MNQKNKKFKLISLVVPGFSNGASSGSIFSLSFLIVLVVFIPLTLMAQPVVEDYPVDSASVEQPGVPKGEVLKFQFNHSGFFPGTARDYWIYIPAQYNPSIPACVYINQDGLQWNAPVVFDNLIYRKEMPVTIGIFISPGYIPAINNVALGRSNRSYEYDGLGNTYARFLLEELLPEVKKHVTQDGRPIRLSDDGNDRAIGGASSGAVCAFTAAWESGGAFSRVFSAIGTYVGLRGADRYPTLIRKYESKPIRFFLQDGSSDLNNFGGDWWMANQTMERALQFAGYEVKHAWGEGGHSGKQGNAVFPEAMRWLWKGWPQPIKKGTSKNEYLNDILAPGSDWELVNESSGLKEGHSIFGPDSSRYSIDRPAKQIICLYVKGRKKIVADHITGNDLTVAYNGNIYVTVSDSNGSPGKVFLIKPGAIKLMVDSGLKYANGLSLTPDQTQLYVAESASCWIWIYSILPDGTLSDKQRYGWLFVPGDQDNAWATSLTCDDDGRIYATTRMGIQVLDHTGRVATILSVPEGQPLNCYFGSPDNDMLYVTCGNKIYRRRLKVHGSKPFEPPHKPVHPMLY